MSDTLDKALAFLTKNQQQNGGFISYSSSDLSDITRTKQTYMTTFFPSLILSCLAGMQSTAAHELKQSITTYLLGQKSTHWSFNYWDRTSKHAAELPYPDDLDDTFCALIAIQQHNPKLLNGKVLASITKLLMQTEQAPGGPYRTWLVSEKADTVWHDIDLAVNANIAYFLKLQHVDLPGLETFIDDKIKRRKLLTSYYPKSIMLLYFISRSYKGQYIDDLIGLLVAYKPQNILETALKLTSLLRLGYTKSRLETLASSILKSQLPDGSWRSYAFCIDPSLAGQTHYAGSPSLTTAFCIEALTLYRAHDEQPAMANDKRYEMIVRAARQKIVRVIQPELKQETLVVLENTLASDNDQQIVLLPWYVAQGTRANPPQKTLKQLALASLWGWTAYTILDDFLDGDGDKVQLPSALFCMRQLIETLHAIMPRNSAFQHEVSNILNKLDAANAWEVSHCRVHIQDGIAHIKQLPDYDNYWQLADRSLGHTIAGLGVLYAAGFHDARLNALRNFFRHYLIARQLNDDAHDWQEDLLSGHINAVGVKILTTWSKDSSKQLENLQLEQEIGMLQRIMWEDTIVGICGDIQKHITLARRALRPQSTGFSPEIFESMLLPLEASTKKALGVRQQAKDFIGNI